jgi:peptidoglycan-N-acetylglucosamine deacetylase
MKKAYLTIDDATSGDLRQKIDFLYAHSIPAVLYCRGEFMEKHPKQVLYAIERGYWIGNHSYSHPYASKISFERFQQEIRMTEEWIQKAYQDAGIQRPVRTFRFPYGDRGNGVVDLFHPNPTTSYVEILQSFLKEEGFQKLFFEGITYPYFLNGDFADGIDVLWTFDNLDHALISKRGQEKYGISNLQDLLDRMDKDLPEQGLGLNDPSSNEIILMHDFEALTFAFEPMIEKYLQKGIRFERPMLSLHHKKHVKL